MDRAKAQRILIEVRAVYNGLNGMSGVENYAREYAQDAEDEESVRYMNDIVDFLAKKNGNASTRLFGLDGFVMDDILKHIEKSERETSLRAS